MQRGCVQAREVELVVEGEPAEVVGPVVLLSVPVSTCTALECGGYNHTRRPRVQISCQIYIKLFTFHGRTADEGMLG